MQLTSSLFFEKCTRVEALAFISANLRLNGSAARSVAASGDSGPVPQPRGDDRGMDSDLRCNATLLLCQCAVFGCISEAGLTGWFAVVVASVLLNAGNVGKRSTCSFSF